MPFTTRGLELILDWAFSRTTTRPTHFFVALCTSASAPAHDTKTLADLTEIAAGHGYTAGGFQLDATATDFPGLAENDTRVFSELATKAVVWTASGGDIPASGAGALYVVMTTDEATVANRQVLWYVSLRSAQTILSGQPFTLTGGVTLRIQGGSMIKSIQRGTLTISAATSGTATIAAVDPSKSSLTLLGLSFANSGAIDPFTYNVTLALTDSTTLTATRGANTITLTIAYEVKEYF